MVAGGTVRHRCRVQEVRIYFMAFFRCHNRDHMTCLTFMDGMEVEELVAMEVEVDNVTSTGSSKLLGLLGDGGSRCLGATT
jgi:hypothetical protein